MKFTDSSLKILRAKTHVQPFKVALIEPEIPQNTGNIGRTCVATGAELHLVGKLGFEINDKNLKRAGLDYWPHLKWFRHADLADWEKTIVQPKRVFYFSAFSHRNFYDEKFQPGDTFVFGKETKGLPQDLLQRNEERCLQLPILGPVRGLNLATAVAIVLYEAVRQGLNSENYAELNSEENHRD